MEAEGTVMSDEQLLAIENKFHLEEDLNTYKGLRDYILDKVIARRQARISFKIGQENEKAKVRAIYKDANDLKELEDHIKEYLLFPKQ